MYCFAWNLITNKLRLSVGPVISNKLVKPPEFYEHLLRTYIAVWSCSCSCSCTRARILQSSFFSTPTRHACSHEKVLDCNYRVGVLILVLEYIFVLVLVKKYSITTIELETHTRTQVHFSVAVLMKKYSTTTIELEYSYLYSSTFFCSRTNEKVLDYNHRVGVLILVLKYIFL